MGEVGDGAVEPEVDAGDGGVGEGGKVEVGFRGEGVDFFEGDGREDDAGGEFLTGDDDAVGLAVADSHFVDGHAGAEGDALHFGPGRGGIEIDEGY